MASKAIGPWMIIVPGRHSLKTARFRKAGLTYVPACRSWIRVGMTQDQVKSMVGRWRHNDIKCSPALTETWIGPILPPPPPQRRRDARWKELKQLEFAHRKIHGALVKKDWGHEIPGDTSVKSKPRPTDL